MQHRRDNDLHRWVYVENDFEMQEAVANDCLEELENEWKIVNIPTSNILGVNLSGDGDDGGSHAPIPAYATVMNLLDALESVAYDRAMCNSTLIFGGLEVYSGKRGGKKWAPRLHSCSSQSI